ncbi:MAG: hypothetical protein N3F08_03135 [Crenarchaeota archaeon]|nr:hypothetical protein [Thermoproteota archaeon]
MARLQGYTRLPWSKYVIEVRNNKHVCQGVKQIVVDGKPIEGMSPDFQRGGYAQRHSGNGQVKAFRELS